MVLPLSRPDFFDIAKDAADGLLQAVVAEDPNRSSYQAFVDDLTEVQFSPLFSALAYDAAGITAQAIEAVGYDGSAIKDYWYSMPVYQGASGDHKFDENGDNEIPAAIKSVQGGKFVKVR
jgi:ABC-type branched-subunit amino acid transport system substrate-binding protein